MTSNCTNQKKSSFTCVSCCLCVLVTSVLLVVITHQVSVRISESTIFLKTENISLIKTFHTRAWNREEFIQDDLRISSYVETINNASFFAADLSGIRREIILKENNDFLVFEGRHRRSGFNINPMRKFENERVFSFYRIQKETRDGKPHIVKIEFLGSIETNLYVARHRPSQNIVFICCDGKYIVMTARGVDSRSLGEFRNKDVLLIWEIGDDVVEKDIVDSTGKKIPIIIKTDEEIERE